MNRITLSNSQQIMISEEDLDKLNSIDSFDTFATEAISLMEGRNAEGRKIDESKKVNLLLEFRDKVGYFKPAPRETFRARIAICITCEKAEALPVPGANKGTILRCLECGCVMNAKARLSGGSCPIGKFK